MTENFGFRILVTSFFPLAIAIFLSVSLIPVYQVLSILASIVLFKSKVINLKKLPLSTWALIAFIGAQLLSATLNFSELHDKARSIGAIKYPMVAIFCLIIFRTHNLLEHEKIKKCGRIAIHIFLATMILAFFYGFARSRLDMFGGFNNTRIGGFTDVMRYGYGSAIVLMVLLTLGLMIRSKLRINKFYFWISWGIGFLGMYLSYTRGAMLGFLLGLPVVLFYYNNRIGKIFTTICAFVVATMITFAIFGGSNKSRFLISLNNQSENTRLSQFQSAFHAFKERPILGFGPGQLTFNVKELKEKYNLEHKEYIQHAHNVFLETAANTGIIGLLTFIAWLLLWANELLKYRNNLAKQMFFPVILFIFVAGQVEMIMMAQTSTMIYFLYAISHLQHFSKEST